MANANANAKKNAQKIEAEANKAEAQKATEQSREEQVGSYFESMTALGGSSIVNAITEIAVHFFEPGKVWDADKKEEVDGNVLAYVQRDMLNAICWITFQRLDKSQVNLDKAREGVKAALRSNDGSEIALNNINRKLGWAEKLNFQHAALADMYEAAKVVHKVITEEEFVEPAKKAAPTATPKEQAETASRLLALGLSPDELASQPNTDGVNTTDDCA